MSSQTGNIAQCTINPSTGEYSAIASILSSCSAGRTGRAEKQATVLKSLTDSYRSRFEQVRAEITSLAAEYTSLNDNKPALGESLSQDIADLSQRKAALAAEIAALQGAAAAAAAEFEENAQPLNNSIAPMGLYTLQDWVTFLAFITYAIAAISVLAYVGYSSGWNKKSIGITTGALIVITMLLYSFFISFA